ncbi:MAG: OsmC family protein [Ectothiorhodospiraceae bacterium AqS1]|nr:OsmC family protein [Ectothiorhodospiraceae bacterium AqS1]
MSEGSLNEVNIAQVGDLIEKIKADPEKAQTKWSAEVKWKEGFRSEATIRQFSGLGSDEPEGLGGDDTAPNPVEQVLAALGNCLAVGYAAGATARQIKIDELTLHLEGELNLKTFLGLEQGNAGFENIQVKVAIKSDADKTTIDELHRSVISTSPVGHTITRAVPVDIELI